MSEDALDLGLPESPTAHLHLLQAASVFHRWRQAATKVNCAPLSQGSIYARTHARSNDAISCLIVQATFRKELTELLDAVGEEEEARQMLQAQHNQTKQQ